MDRTAVIVSLLAALAALLLGACAAAPVLERVPIVRLGVIAPQPTAPRYRLVRKELYVGTVYELRDDGDLDDARPVAVVAVLPSGHGRLAVRDPETPGAMLVMELSPSAARRALSRLHALAGFPDRPAPPPALPRA